MAAGVKQHLWVMDTIYNYGDKALFLMLPQFSNFTPELQPLAKSPLAKHCHICASLQQLANDVYLYIYNLVLILFEVLKRSWNAGVLGAFF